MTIMIMKVTKPQAVIRPFTSLNISVIRQRSSQCNKTASGNLAFHWLKQQKSWKALLRNKTASGNLAFHELKYQRDTAEVEPM